MNIRINADLSIKKLDSEFYILDRQNSMIHCMNKTGSLIWEMLSTGASIQSIVETLTNTYEVSEETARNDLHEFFASCEKQKLIFIKSPEYGNTAILQ
ncbi:MAG: PqqD family protein [Chitinivibrionales bacterium]|nr:PqqD family protein [Chitinivibrionales bacterium]